MLYRAFACPGRTFRDDGAKPLSRPAPWKAAYWKPRRNQGYLPDAIAVILRTAAPAA